MGPGFDTNDVKRSCFFSFCGCGGIFLLLGGCVWFDEMFPHKKWRACSVWAKRLKLWCPHPQQSVQSKEFLLIFSKSLGFEMLNSLKLILLKQKIWGWIITPNSWKSPIYIYTYGQRNTFLDSGWWMIATYVRWCLAIIYNIYRNPRWERWVFARFVFSLFFHSQLSKCPKTLGKPKKTKKHNPVRRILGKSM